MHDNYDEYKEMEEEILGALTAKNGSIQVDANIKIDNNSIANIVASNISRELSARLIKRVDHFINQKVNNLVNTTYHGGIDTYMREVVHSLVKKRFEEKYPESVDGKVDNILACLEKYQWDTDSYGVKQNVRDQIKSKFKEYLDREFKEIVDKTKQNIDEYAQNYFSRNLFKAMNLMSEMTEIEKVKKLT